jgi:hypothetical protein
MILLWCIYIVSWLVGFGLWLLYDWHFEGYVFLILNKVAERSKVLIFFIRSDTDIMCSNSIKGIDVYVYSVFVLSCTLVQGLRRADPPSKESYRLCIESTTWKKWPKPNNGLQNPYNNIFLLCRLYITIFIWWLIDSCDSTSRA